MSRQDAFVRSTQMMRHGRWAVRQIGPSLTQYGRKEGQQSFPLHIAEFFAPQQKKIRLKIRPLPLAYRTCSGINRDLDRFVNAFQWVVMP